MQSDWHERKKWGERFLPQIKTILGYHLITAAPDEEDMERNSDLMVLKVNADMRIACRVRGRNYLDMFGDEFTIRCEHSNGAKTELDKVLDGWGDYLFYGFADAPRPNGKRIIHWLIGDLDVFRTWFNAKWSRTGRMPGKVISNGPGDSLARAFAIDELPSSFVIARRESQERVRPPQLILDRR